MNIDISIPEEPEKVPVAAPKAEVKQETEFEYKDNEEDVSFEKMEHEFEKFGLDSLSDELDAV
jgi:hypothetical protein